MRNSLLLPFLKIFALIFILRWYCHMPCAVSLLQPSVADKFEGIEKLIEATFNGYSCLNIFIPNDDVSDYRSNVIRLVHQSTIQLSVRLIDSLENGTHRCGFLVISNNTEELRDFASVRYEDVIRVLFIDLSRTDDDGILLLDTDEMRIHDMDLALVKLNASEDNTKIFIKSRYENKTHIVDANFSKSFFDHKNFVPITVNYNKKIVRAMTFDFSIFNIIVNGELIDGIEARIYRELARKLNFTPVAVLPTDGVRWGLSFPNGTITGGILKALYEREVDVGLGAFWIDFSKLWVSTFSNFWDFECLQFLIPKPKQMPPRWDNILEPLPRDLWMLVLFSVIIVSSACYLLRYIEEEIMATISKGMTSVVTEVITVMGIFLLAKNPEKNHGQSVNRHVFMWWSLFALLITTLYSSSLVSHLTYPQFEPMIETIEGLVKAGYYWGTDYPIMSDRFMDVEVRCPEFERKRGQSRWARYGKTLPSVSTMATKQRVADRWQHFAMSCPAGC